MTEKAVKLDKSYKKDLEMYSFIVNYKMSHDGNSPSVREIMDAVGYKSSSAVFYRLKSLEKSGLIRAGKDRNRSVEIVRGYMEAYERLSYLISTCDTTVSLKYAIDRLIEWAKQ